MAKKVVSVLRETLGHIEVEWDILNFVDLPHKRGEEIESPTFLLNDAKWVIWIYPKGDSRCKSDEWISLFLKKNSSSGGEHSVSFSLEIKAAGTKFEERTLEHTFSDTSNSWGIDSFVKRSVVLAYLKDAPSDSPVTVMCTVCFLDARPQTSHPNGIENLSKHFEKLFLCGQRADAKLRVGEREFDVHKAVLGARSPVFDAMFHHEMTERTTGVVEIADTDPEIFEEFLIFLYTGNFDKITFKNSPGLYKAADKYDLCDLKTQCSLRMASELSVDNVLDVLLLAATYEETELFDNATEYFIKNAGKIFITDTWETFMFENTSLAKDLLIKMYKKLESYVA